MSWDHTVYLAVSKVKRALLDASSERIAPRFQRLPDAAVARFAARGEPEATFLGKLRSAPDDGTRRVYADWLEERGEHERATVVRHYAGERLVDEGAYEDLELRVGRSFTLAVSVAWVDPEEVARRDAGEFAFEGFLLTFHQHPAGCFIHLDSQECDDARTDAAAECMTMWAAELGGEIDEADWLARVAKLEATTGAPVEEDPPANDEEDEDEGEDEDEEGTLGPPSKTVIVARTLDEKEFLRLEIPAKKSHQPPEGLATDPERMKANVNCIEFSTYDPSGVLANEETQWFDGYGRPLSPERK